MEKQVKFGRDQPAIPPERCLAYSGAVLRKLTVLLIRYVKPFEIAIVQTSVKYELVSGKITLHETFLR